MRQLIQILSQILPIVFGRSIELVTPHESVDERCPAEHFFDIGGSGLMVVDSIAQAIGGLLEILHGLVDLFFRSAAIDRVAINRSIETGAERIRAFVDATQQIFHLLIARTGWLL